MEYTTTRIDPSKWRDDFDLDNNLSSIENERIKMCEEYRRNIKHSFLKLADVKDIDSSKMFLAIIDYDDSKKFRSTHVLKTSLFPMPTILGNLDGNIYDFCEYMYLDLEKYYINYSISFKDIIEDDYWHFSYDFDDMKISVITSNVDKNIKLDKYISKRIWLSTNRNELYDENALNNVLGSKIIKKGRRK